jgi:hypothetical protein
MSVILIDEIENEINTVIAGRNVKCEDGRSKDFTSKLISKANEICENGATIAPLFLRYCCRRGNGCRKAMVIVTAIARRWLWLLRGRSNVIVAAIARP